MTAAPGRARSEERFDGTVVVGLGGIGSAAAAALATRGEAVVGLDPRPTGHRDGSSHGSARLVRQAYFEDPAYVPLAGRAWALWHGLEAAAGERLLTPSGVLSLGSPDDPIGLVPAVLGAATRHGLPVEPLEASEVRRRYPALTVPGGWQAVLERAAGFVDPEAAIRAQLRLARAAGAELRDERVLRIEPGDRPLIVTAGRRIRASAVVVAAGPWAPDLLAASGLPIVARRKVVAHFTPREGSELGPDALPGFVISEPAGLFYGFPDLPGRGVRIGRHDGGEDTTADAVDRVVRSAEVDELRAVLERLLPAAAGPLQEAATCLYTMSPDGDLVVGPLPGAAGVVVATGCSGHAFKFVPALGEALADLATGRSPHVDLGFLDPARFVPAAPDRSRPTQDHRRE